jgi:hypothetical protein
MNESASGGCAFVFAVKNLGMTSIKHELSLAIGWLWHAMPNSQHWAGFTADTCRDQIEEVLQQLRSVNW